MTIDGGVLCIVSPPTGPTCGPAWVQGPRPALLPRPVRRAYASEATRVFRASRYVGLSPYEAPAVFSLLQAMELDAASYGVRYPRGGFGRVRRRLLEQCDGGGGGGGAEADGGP